MGQKWAKRRRAWLLISVAFCSLLWSGLCLAAPPKRIHVVADGSFPPFMFFDKQGKPQGFEADMWRLFEKYTGIAVDLEPTTWTLAKQKVLSGQADVVDMMMPTPDRQKRFTLGSPFIRFNYSIYTDKKVGRISDVDALKGVAIGVESDDVCAHYLSSRGVKGLRNYVDYEDVVKAAVEGELHVFCVDQYSARYFLNYYGGTRHFSEAFVLASSRFHRAVKKGNEDLLRVIEQGMQQIPNSERRKLEKKWLEGPADWTPYLQVIVYAIIAIGLAAILIALWAWMLRRRVLIRTKELRGQKNNIRALLDSSPDAIWFEDLDGVYEAFNSRMKQVFEIKKTDLLGKRDSQCLPPYIVEQLHAKDKEMLEQGRQVRLVLSSKNNLGEPKYYEVIKAPIYDAEGQIKGTVGSARDVTQRIQTQKRLQLWVQAFQNARFGIAIIDVKQHTFLEVSPFFAKERGYSQQDMAGMDVDSIYPQAVRQKAGLLAAMQTRDHIVVQSLHKTRGGRIFPVAIDCSVTRDENGQAQHAIVYVQDITQRLKNEKELRLSAVSFQSQSALMIVDTDYTIQRVNQAFVDLLGYSHEELVGQPLSMVRSNQHSCNFYTQVWDEVESQGIWRGEQWFKTKNSRPKITSLALSAVYDDDNRITHYVFSIVDLTNVRRAQENVNRMTHFDALTGLPNRRYLQSQLQYFLQETDRSKTGILVLININQFKRVNDLYGHAVGDLALEQMTQRLQKEFTEQRFILARFIGDTFALFESCGDETDQTLIDYATSCHQRIKKALSQPFDLDVRVPITLDVVLGWTSADAGTKTADSVLKEAELAVHKAKENTQIELIRYLPYMQQELAAKEILVHDLRQALINDEFELYLQAQVNFEGRTMGAEALLRWIRPDGQSISPAVFIPVAEKNGLMLVLGQWVLERACQMIKYWSEHHESKDLVMAINVSAIQFAQPDFVATVEKTMRDVDIDPTKLKIEVTETVLLNGLEKAAKKLKQLKALGIQTALDDFGTGYSSLAYLSRLPLDQLKIDKSFVDHLLKDEINRMVAKTIINLGHGLGLHVIAEGVETEQQYAFLKAQNCDAVQGYLFSKPVPKEQFSHQLKAQNL